MTASENLQEIIIKQKTTMAELEQEVKALLNSDAITENEALKKEVGQMSAALAKSDKAIQQLTAQNTALKNALFDHVYSQKLNLINNAREKSDIYFKSSSSEELNKLTILENYLHQKIKGLTLDLQKSRIEVSNELYQNLDELSAQVRQTAADAREKIARESGAFTAHSQAEFSKLKEEQITDEMIESVGKKNNLEAFVGGNLINKLGILFVILGIIAVSRYTFFSLPDTFKGIVMFAISGGLLLLGELMNRKKTSIFSLGITSGGVAGLYASLSISYFALDIISMYPAILLCVLITMGAFVLSQRYNSQTIAAFALIGGYIPIVSISESVTLSYGAMVYFIALNLLALLISFHKKWKLSTFVGFFLNLIGTLYIVNNMIDSSPANNSFGTHQLFTILYILFAFTIYTLIPVLSNYRKKLPFTRSDMVILGMNTVLSAMIMYIVFYSFRLEAFNGLLTIFFAIVYIFLGKFIETHFKNEKNTLALFYLTGLTFVVLIIPFQFGKQWLSLGWLVQGVALAVYGITHNEKNFKAAGLFIGWLCVMSFIFVDVFLQIDSLFAYKYFAITLGSLMILAAFILQKLPADNFEKGFKYATLINLWFYCLYAVNLLCNNLFYPLPNTPYNEDFLISAALVTVTFLLAFALPNIPILLDKGVKLISVVLSVFGVFGLLFITTSDQISYHIVNGYPPVPLPVMAFASVVLILLSVLAVLAMRNVLMYCVLANGLGVEWLPFGLSAYSIIILSQNLIMQYGIAFTSIAISIIYVVAALAWIIYGFVKQFVFMRRFGLGLSILAIAKLFLIDLPNMTTGSKIVSYFSFGVALLGISFVYQYFSKRFTLKGVVEDVENIENANEDNQ